MKKPREDTLRFICFRDFPLFIYGLRKHDRLFMDVMKLIRSRKKRIQKCLDRLKLKVTIEVAFITAKETSDIKKSPQKICFLKPRKDSPIRGRTMVFKKGESPFPKITNSPIYISFHESITRDKKRYESKINWMAHIIIHEVIHAVYGKRDEKIANLVDNEIFPF
jgi:hypothetical protein